MKKILLLILLLEMNVLETAGQQNLFVFQTENDAYLVQFKDGYYTNGIKLHFNWRDSNNQQLHHISIGQQMFTAGSKSYTYPVEIDRPYAGYLYAAYGKTSFPKKDQAFHWNLSLGVMGKNALAQPLQNLVHDILNLSYFKGWQYQINNTATANLYTQYTKVWRNQHTAILAVPSIQLGTPYTLAKASWIFTLGKMNALSETNLFNHRTASNSKEFIVYFQPSLIYQFHNSTIEGAWYQKLSANAVVRPVERLMYQHKFGFLWARNRWSTKLEVIYETKQAATQHKQQRYGNIEFGYLF